MADASTVAATTGEPRDPRTIARKYQLDLCKRAVEENIIVYLGTGCGKTHIAVLLIYELGHLIRKPSREVCIFLAPTVPLVRQQAAVIENSTNFKVKSYCGKGKSSRDHQYWEKEMGESEVLVMTPQILFHNLSHCYIRMNSIALLIFDECHHAQVQKRHSYAQIMKEFYKNNAVKTPRVFGMTASPVVGKGGSNKLNYTKCINSLEELLHAKVCSVDNAELESVIAFPDMEVYSYGPVSHSNLTVTYNIELEGLKLQSECILRESLCNFKDSQKKLKYSQKKLKSLWRLHGNLIFCLQELGSFGALQAARTSLSFDGDELDKKGDEINVHSTRFLYHYLNKAISILSCNILDGAHDDSLEILEEPFFSNKFAVLINVLSRYRLEENMKCIVFVKRITVARAIAHILQNVKCLDFWKCACLVGRHSGLKNMSRNKMDAIVEKFSSGEVNLLVATSVGEEGLDIQTCCLVVRFDLPETVASYIQSRGRARMTKSKYVVLLERGNLSQQKLLDDYVAGESIMNKEIDSRTTNDIFDCLEENAYRVNSTGASISTAYSVSLLHRYCDNLPKDMFFTPSPELFYIDDIGGIICRVILPPNAAFRQVDGQPYKSKDEAKRDACLKACVKLHELGALSDFLLPGSGSRKNNVSTTNSSPSSKAEDGSLGEELHEMLIPAVLKPSSKLDCLSNLHFYYVKIFPIPADRSYQMFGIFVINPLPKEAEKLEVDLHLAHGRIVKAGMKYLGTTAFDEEQMMLARNFQEMFLKILLDRSQFTSSHVILGSDDAVQINSTFYLLLPIMLKSYGEIFMIDWSTVERCLSSPVFKDPISLSVRGSYWPNETFRLLDEIYSKTDVVGSLVFTPHNNTFFVIDDVLDELNARSECNGATYAEYYKERFGIELCHPEQPLLKAKQLFNLRNLLHDRLRGTTGRELLEYFVKLPPELCSLKVTGFSKDMCSSLSLLPSLMYRLENLLVAIELKDVMLSCFPEASQISASGILEALTTERCLERISLERFEVLGDAFLKYVVGRHNFISYEGLDEGQLTKRRSAIVNNSNLYELSIRRNLQVYIRDQQFEPAQFFALGRPCKVVCSADTEMTIHQMNIDPDRRENCNLRCTKSHHWLPRKTIADAVESLVGTFLVEGGFKAAFAFLHWMGIDVDFEDSALYKVLGASSVNLSLMNHTNIAELEELIGYKFKHKGLILEAFVHPSFNQHSGGCYQKLEFLGDAVLEYLITSYLYSTYPDLNPGQITDLRSLAVGNNSLAYVAVKKCIHKYLIKDSNHLTMAVDAFENYIKLSNSEKDLVEEPACPKVLGDIIESCVAAVLLDSGFNLNYVWKLMLMLLRPVLSFSDMHINPMRELRELCQYHKFELDLPKPTKADGEFHVKVEVNINSKMISCTAANRNSKVAKKLAAQETLSKLKNYGYRHKNKSVEEFLRDARKQEPELIGYNEEPIKVDTDIFVEMKNLQISEERNVNISFQNVEFSTGESSKTANQRTTGDIKLFKDGVNNEKNNQLKVAMQNGWLTSGATQKHDKNEYHGDMVHKTARSFLYELCAACHWKPPVFELCKEEELKHLQRFTYKVMVHIRGPSETLLECYSDPKLQKKAAQEHAAQGALWYLKQHGYLPKDEIHV